jgi:hypothetical protein
MSINSVKAMALALVLAAGVLQAQGSDAPVALVAQLNGQASVQHSGEHGVHRMFWLDLLYPQDHLTTGDNARVITLFFKDGHEQAVGPATTAQVSAQGLVGTHVAPLTRPSAYAARYDVPSLLLHQVSSRSGSHTAQELAREQTYLAGKVDNMIYPPAFSCRDLKLASYRFQIYDERGQLIYQKTVGSNHFRFPRTGKLHLLAGGYYQWEVLAPDGSPVVAQYPFSVLTRPQIAQIGSAESRVLHKGGAATERDYAELFLTYQSVAVPDKMVHLLQKLMRVDPGNPNVRSALSQAYLLRGCPAHARDVF